MPIPWRLETWCHGPIFCLCYLWLLDSVQLISVAQNEPRVDVNRSLNGVGWNVWEKSQFNVELWWLISIEDTHAISVMQIWVIWAQSIDSMIKDCRIKRSNESLFKTELFLKNWALSSVATFHGLSFWQLTGNGSYLIICLRRFHREQNYLCMRQAWGRPSNQANKQPAAKGVAKTKTHENKDVRPKTRKRIPESENPFTILIQKVRVTLHGFTNENN